MIVEVILLAVAFGFGVRPSSMAMLTLAGVSSAVCFVGFMMLIASLGKTEQTASGAGWAILMPLSMMGGAMVPQFVMPQWMQTAGQVSPIRWVILAIEGGIWRQFTLSEMVMPCAILISVGVACFAARHARAAGSIATEDAEDTEDAFLSASVARHSERYSLCPLCPLWPYTR